MSKVNNYIILIVLSLSIASIGIVDVRADSGLWTGCIDSHRGDFYSFKLGISPINPCRNDDYNVSFYTKDYVDNLTSKIEKLENLLVNVTRNENDVYFDTMNIHVRSGTGSTDGNVNGLGNLIIGYNELRNDSTDNRTGSNNLVLGSDNNYKSYGGTVGGIWNEISGQYSSVIGGSINIASIGRSVVIGGYDNRASGGYSVVSGGASNTASSSASSVSGGSDNIAYGERSSVSGGQSRNSSGYLDWRAGELFQDN